jgi:hypothetical protein
MADYGTKLTGFNFSNFVGENVSQYDWNTIIGTDANCLAFMVAERSRVTQSSDRVSAWADRSDNNKDATQATSGNQPLIVDNVFGTLAGLRFNRTRVDRMTSAVTLPTASDLSVVLILKPSVLGGNARYPLSGGGSAGFMQAEITSDGRFGFSYGSGTPTARSLTNAAQVDGTAKAIRGEYDRAAKTATVWANGVAGTPNTAATQPPDLAATTLMIGSRYDATLGYENDIGAIIVYDVALSKAGNEAKLANAKAFVLNRYGLAL